MTIGRSSTRQWGVTVKRRLLLLAAIVFFVPHAGASEAAQYSSVVIDADTGNVLYAADPDSLKHPASLTKMMTLYMIFEALENKKLSMDQKLPVSRTAAGRSPSKLGLKPGESIRVRDIIAALITKSANDAATVVAEALGETERKFAVLMTKKARELGMSRTVFRNASGLPHYRQLSTARDMAILSRALIRDFPAHYKRFSRDSFTFRGRVYRNHNHLLDDYDGMDGIKTGYIRASGFNLAASAERRGRRIIGVIFGGKSPRWRDRHMTTLLDRGFASLKPLPSTVIAAPVPKPKPDRDAVVAETLPSTDADQGWAIQVGAFSNFAPAQKAVKKAAKAVPTLTTSRITVVPDEGEQGRVYRARLVGLSETLARASCVQLQQKKINCIVVPSDVSLAQGSQ